MQIGKLEPCANKPRGCSTYGETCARGYCLACCQAHHSDTLHYTDKAGIACSYTHLRPGAPTKTITALRVLPAPAPDTAPVLGDLEETNDPIMLRGETVL